MRKKGKYIWLFFFLVIWLTGCEYQSEETVKEEAVEQETVSKAKASDYVYLPDEGVEVRFAYGMNGTARYDRYTAVAAVMKSSHQDFEGYMQVALPGQQEENTFYTNFHVGAGESQKVFLFFPVSMAGDEFDLSIHRKNGDEVFYDRITVNVDRNTETIYTGIYSRHVNQFGYLNHHDSRVFYLKKSDFAGDFKALDLFDMLVISDQDMRRMSKGRIAALEMWVKRGGTLVLADSGQERELEPFQDSLLKFSVKEKKKIETSLGLDKSDLEMVKRRMAEKRMEEKVEKVQAFLEENLPVSLYENWSTEIKNLKDNSYCLDESEEIYGYLREKFSAKELKQNLSVKLDESEREEIVEGVKVSQISRKWCSLVVDKAELILLEEGHVLLQKVSAGLGNVVVSGCSLAFEPKDWDVLGLQMQEIFCGCLTMWKQRQLLQESNMILPQDNYICKQGLAVTEMDNLPNLKFYIVILSIYVLMIGPVFFVLFRRKGRTMFLWLAIPVCSLCFTLIIYLMGMGTRVRRPYVNYLSQIQLGTRGEADMQTWFRMVNSSSKTFETMFRGGCDVRPLSENEFVQGYDTDAKSWKDRFDSQVRFRVSYEKNSTRVSTQNLSSFEGVDLWNQETIALDGDINASITSNEMLLEGIVTNNFSFDLEDCFLLDNGTFYFLGDMKAGESVRMEELRKKDIYRQSEYQYDYGFLMEKIFGTNYWGGSRNADSLSQRKAALAQAYLENAVSSESFFYGFAAGRQFDGKSLMDNLSYEKYGVVGIVRRISIQYTSDGMEILPDISQYAMFYDSSITDGKTIKSLDRKRLEVSYQLPAGYEWKGLIYNQNNNPEFGYFENGSLTSAIFNGTVTMIDQSTGQEVEVLQSGRQTKINIEPKNIGVDGTLTLYYYLDISSGAELQLPNIMVAVEKVDEEKTSSSSFFIESDGGFGVDGRREGL